jgi:ubiquinone/menaquinone biosynthesis C-methylase UbiE
MAVKVPDRKWLRRRGEFFVRESGVSREQSVLDFGCGEGNYAIPAARVVGPRGRVYAADRDEQKLKVLARAAREEGIENLTTLHAPEGERVRLRPRSVDVVLLYDVLHRGYFPEDHQRAGALRAIRRALKPQGLLSCYPTHLRKYGMTFERVLREVRGAGFSLVGERRTILIHDGSRTRGRVFSFVKSNGRRR